jgi:citrate synthase
VSGDYSPGLEDVVAAETAISFLDTERERIVVRGYDLIELARTVRFPDVAHLLIRGHLPSPEEQTMFCAALGDQMGLPDGIVDILRRLPRETAPIDALRTGISLLAGFEDPHLLADTSPEADERKAIRLLARAPTLTAAAYRASRGQPVVEPNPGLGFAGNFLWMIYGRASQPEVVPVFDRILTAYAEHEMAASTFAARVTASTLADLYAAVVAGAAAIKGPLHGGANEAAARMFADIRMQGGPSVAEAYILERLQRKERVMGFGHRVYVGHPDPRAVLLKEDLDAFAARDPDAAPLVRTYEIVTETMAREKDIHPNADLPIGLLMHLMGIPVELFTPIFLCARIAGISAHVMEQHAANRLYRPRVRYGGPSDLAVPEGLTPSRC